MSTVLTDAINALVTYSNSVTGASDTTLSEAIATLAAGYQGGGTGTITYPAVNGMPLTAAINALIAYSNQVTGASDTTASEAVATLVAGYGGGGGLPDAYQEVEWVGIPSKNGAYIDTGVACSATTIRMVAKYVHLGSSDCYGVATKKGDGSNNQYSFFGYYSRKSQFAWGTYFYGPACSPNTVYEADATFKNRDQQIVLNGVSGSNNKAANANGTGTFYIFGRNNDGVIGNQPDGMRFYYLQMYMDGELVRDFVPCYRKSDDEIGMYDLVSNSFFTNAGSGSFAKGNDV